MGKVEISRNLSKQPFSTGSGRKTMENSLKDYFQSPDFRMSVLKCAGSYSRVFTVFYQTVIHQKWSETGKTVSGQTFAPIGAKKPFSGQG